MNDKNLEREKLKQELLEEIKQEYYLKPKSDKLEVGDILNKYIDDVLKNTNRTFPHNAWSQKESTNQSIRRVVCLHFGYYSLKDIPKEKYKEFREEMENFITSYLGMERKD